MSARRWPREELIAEVEWLLNNGTHGLMIAQQLGISPSTIERACQRGGRHDLATKFSFQ